MAGHVALVKDLKGFGRTAAVCRGGGLGGVANQNVCYRGLGAAIAGGSFLVDRIHAQNIELIANIVTFCQALIVRALEGESNGASAANVGRQLDAEISRRIRDRFAELDVGSGGED